MELSGIPAEAFDFYDALTADNSKAFWVDHKQEYERFVKEPLLSLAVNLEPEFGKAHLYRPYRDLRFSKDKTPYNDHQGMFVESNNGLGWYLQINTSGLMIAGGWYMSDAVQLRNYRERIGGDGRAPKLRQFLSEIEDQGFEIGGERLKTKPRGVAGDHPDLDLLRYKSIYASRQWAPSAWMGTKKCETRIAEGWRALTPWMDWQAKLVGPGQTPTGSRRGKGRTDTK